MDKICFTVNGEHYSLTGSDVSNDTSLNDYLRYNLNLHGTKAMCHEGGCGACIVSVSQTHPVTKEKHSFAVNSCLVHVLSCHQWDITTIEGVGNRRDGYHPLQTRLASFNGTQCGYCSPGWIMNMFSLQENSEKMTMKQIENSFAGNMCRCTGYRPILDAFKSFASDVDPKPDLALCDLEDLSKIPGMKCKSKCTRKCSVVDNEWCIIDKGEGQLMEIDMKGRDSRWYKAFTVQDVFNVLAREGVNSYSLVAGNTGRGVYPVNEDPRILIDISSIETLKGILLDANLVLGAGMPLAEVMTEFKAWAEKNEDFRYLEEFYKHLDLVAHVPVRNIGTIGGNLALKNLHHDFPSDVFLLMETVGATVTLMDNKLAQRQVEMQNFLKEDLKNKIILDVKVPPLSTKNLIKTFKIMPRAQNAHAILNAGFNFKLDSEGNVVASRIVFGSISPSFSRATETESVLKGKKLFKDETIQKALKALSDELMPVDIPPEPAPFARKCLALGLFYKAILSLCPEVDPRYKSGGAVLERPVSRATQTYDTDKSLWPLNKPVPKMEALTQCSGEVKYSCDTTTDPREVHVAFVLSTVCVAEIDRFDATDALKMPGVVAFFTANDIPGKNNFTPIEVPWQEAEEEILASKSVLYYGQPVALVAAVTRKLAIRAADAVKVYYKNIKEKPVLTIKDALIAPDREPRIRREVKIDASDKGQDSTHIISGSYSIGSQYHYTMETQCCTVSNTDQGVSVRSSTQWMDLVHIAVAKALNIDENRVDLTVPRIGGAYGGKASRSAIVACACAIVAYKLNRTASLVMPLTDNMVAIGKRQECDANYEIGVNDEGLVQYVKLTYYSDCGCSFNDTAATSIAGTLTNLYNSARWNITGYSVLTDKHSNTWCRAPSTTEATAIIEHFMERIAHTTGKDSLEIKLLNISPKHAVVREIVDTFKVDTQYNERRAKIDKFNSENAWKKRGLKISLMSYPIDYFGNFAVTISVYHADGTISISHAGVEMGQGINTKVAQVCAYQLKVPLEKITVKASNNFTSPNAMASNGSITSECVAYAAVQACKQLLARLEPSRSALNEPTWEEVVKEAYNKGVDLQTSYMMSQKDSLTGYNVYGACATEVELDVLTGTHLVRRVDLLEDTGVSMSPDIDVGQIEGAFIMGLGMWTSENLIYDPATGRLLVDRTWTYKPPGVKDIPIDFRISFRRNSVNNAGVLRSKATGEPALVLAVGVTHALHEAILEARKEFQYNDSEWISVGTPNTVENILKAISPKIENYKLK